MRRKFCLFSLIVMVSLTFLLAGCGGSKQTPSDQDKQGQADKPVTLKLGHYFSTDDFRGRTAQYFADAVEKKSDGNIKIQIFPSEQLVKGKEGFQSTVQGTVDLFPALTAYISGQIPVLDFFNLPLPPVNYTDEVMLKLVEEKRDLLSKAIESNGAIYLGTANSSGGAGYFFRSPVHTLEDIKGKKMRGPGGLGDKAINSLGASAVFMSAGEQYLALQTGTVDGTVTTFSSYVSNKLYEVAPYWVRVVPMRTPYFMVMNKAKWSNLSTNQQNILLEAMKETTQWSFANLKADEEKLEGVMRTTAKEEYSLDKQEYDRWYEKLEPLYAKYLQDAGADGQELMTAFEGLIK